MTEKVNILENSNSDISPIRKIASWAFSKSLAHKWYNFGGDVILMYHRIINPKDTDIIMQDGMYTMPETFRMQLQLLKEHADVISLEDFLLNTQKNSNKSRKKIAITFDDGWIDFETNALPVLKEFKLPATVFLPTSFINTSKLFWTDSISKILSFLIKNPEVQSKYFSKNIDNKSYSLKVLKNSLQAKSFSEAIEPLIETLKLAEIQDRLVFIKDLKDLCLESGMNPNTDKFLSWSAVKRISDEGLISFGSHSHKHEISTSLSAQAFKEDISSSISAFKENKIPMTKIFCYPNQNRSEECDDILQNLGFLGALASTKTTSLLAENKNFPIGIRLGIHEHISYNTELFLARVWLNR